jgi:hypothetical protein
MRRLRSCVRRETRQSEGQTTIGHARPLLQLALGGYALRRGTVADHVGSKRARAKRPRPNVRRECVSGHSARTARAATGTGE